MVPAKSRKSPTVVGNTNPRIAPPVPALSNHQALVSRRRGARAALPSVAGDGSPLHQRTGSDHRLAVPRGRRRSLLARTARPRIMRPLIVERLFAGHRIVHAAQDLKLPREMHEEVATVIDEQYREFLPPSGEASSTESGRSPSGSRPAACTTLSPTVGAVRVGRRTTSFWWTRCWSWSTWTSSRPPSRPPSPARGARWSTSPTRAPRPASSCSGFGIAPITTRHSPTWNGRPSPSLPPDDLKGWLQANPSIGHNPVLLPNLEGQYRSHVAGGSLDVWEREHLCRQTLARFQSIVTPEEWSAQEFVEESTPSRPCLGVKMDIGGERASAVLAWTEEDGRTGLEVIADVEGHPIDVDRLGPDLQKIASEKRVQRVAFDPYTDADLAQHLRRAKPLTGRDYANASEKFVRLVAGAAVPSQRSPTASWRLTCRQPSAAR